MRRVTIDTREDEARKLEGRDRPRLTARRLPRPAGRRRRPPRVGVPRRQLARPAAPGDPRRTARRPGRLGAARRRGAPRGGAALAALPRAAARAGRATGRRRAARGRGDELAHGQPAPADVSFYRPTGGGTASSSRTPLPLGQLRGAQPGAFHGLDPDTAVVRLRPRPGEDTLRTEDVVDPGREAHRSALVLLGGVNYLTGELMDIPAITAAGRAAGAVVGWDLAHAVGNVPLAPARLGRRLRRLVLLQVPELRAGRAGRRVRARAAPRRRDAAPLRGLVEHRGGHPVRDAPGVAAAAHRRRLADLQPADLRDGPGAHLAGAVRRGRHGGAARAQPAAHRLPGGAPRGAGRPAACASSPRATRRGAAPALGARRRRQRRRADQAAARTNGVIADAREPDIVRFAPVPLYSTYHDCWRAARRCRTHRGGEP